MKPDTLFLPGEAEALVLHLREQLRRAESATESEAATRQVDALLEELLLRLAPRFERYARGNFGGRGREAREDAVREMIFQVCRGVRDLSPRAGARCFETHFNAAIERCLYDAIRKIWREENARNREQSLQTSEEDEERGEQIDDARAVQALEQIIDRTALSQLAAQLPSPRHVQVLGLRLGGATWDGIAAHLQISEKTARNDYEAMKPLLKRFLLGP